MTNNIIDASNKATGTTLTRRRKSGLTVDTALKTAVRLWLVTAFVTAIFWLPPIYVG